MTTRQVISVGSAANDGTGDTLRSAGNKINTNFSQIYTVLGGNASDFSTQIALTDSAVQFNPGSNEVYLSAQPSITADRHIKLPDASGVVTLNTATQTLTNKTVTVSNLFATNTNFTGTGTITNTDGIYIKTTNSSGSNYNLTLNDGSAIGQIKIFTNTGSSASDTVTIQPSSGSNFTLADNGRKICIWDGSNWLQVTSDFDQTI
jgi:hypothetical protein